MGELLNLLQNAEANVAVTIGLQDLRAVAAEFAEQVVERLRESTAVPSMPSESEQLLTAAEVCDMLGVTKQTLWRWDKLNYLKKVRVGNCVRYRRADVLAISNNQNK